MKYQFQFAGANVARTKEAPRKRIRMGVLLAGLILAGAAYGHYSFFMPHAPVSAIAPAKATVPLAASAVTSVSPAASSASGTGLPAALKQAADAGAQMLGNLIGRVATPTAPTPASVATTAEPVASTPASPVAVPVSPAKPIEAAPATQAAPFKVVATPVRRAPRVLTPEQQMAAAAQVAMEKMLAAASKYPDAYGFRAEDALSEAVLGKPIAVYTIADKDRAAYKGGQPLQSILKAANQWVYPVICGSHICCMVQISHNGHEYIPGNASKSLAQAWDKVNELWPAAEGFHPLLIVNSRIPGFYFTVPEADKPNITDTVQMFYHSPSLSPADVILASWR